ncbi:MAG: DUF6036 family nucleotidyltransferase [Candidatus Woesearchaeota archaeon]
MINTQDQEELFKLIADYLEEDSECVAIGGTAMMFQGYKTTTKDIDLVFKSELDRNIFIKAIEKLGYAQKSLKLIYDEKRLNNKNKPVMYSRGEERFDLFVKNVFGFDIDLEKFVQRHDFIGKKELIIFTLSKEYLILLKSITGREKDYEDIETIVKIEKNIDWNSIIDAAIQKRKQIIWILHDLEETMQKLKKITFIKKEHFDKIYKAEGKQK